MGWLYRGAFSAAFMVGPDNERNSLGFMGFPVKMLKILLSYDIKPICVFDGRTLNGKVNTVKKRTTDKYDNKDKCHSNYEKGDKKEALKWATRSLFIKYNQCNLFEELLDVIGIDHITSPYEADAQIAYMV